MERKIICNAKNCKCKIYATKGVVPTLSSHGHVFEFTWRCLFCENVNRVKKALPFTFEHPLVTCGRCGHISEMSGMA